MLVKPVSGKRRSSLSGENKLFLNLREASVKWRDLSSICDGFHTSVVKSLTKERPMIKGLGGIRGNRLALNYVIHNQRQFTLK